MSGTTIHRGFLSLAVVLVLAASIGSYLAWRAWGPLGDPAAASPWDLWRWLSEKRLADEPLPTRLALVGRLEEELRGGLELPADAAASTTQFRDNCRLLESDWFYDRCQQWSKLPADDAPLFMQAQLDLLAKWLVAIPEGSPNGSPSSPPAESLGQKIERWLKDAPAAQKDASLAAVRAGLFQWLCTTDLALLEPATQLDLSERITAELDSKRDLTSRLGKLPADQRDRLRRNGWLLAQAWWTGQSRRFVETPAAARDQFAATLVQRLEKWDLSALRADSGAGDAPGAPLEQLIAELERWSDSAEPADAEPMRQLSSRVGKVLAMRALQRLWG